MALLYPSLVKAKQPISTTQSFEGRNIWYVKFSDNPNVDENENEVLYTALHHAREGASLSQLIFYMWYLLENYATDPDIKETLNNSELFFVPASIRMVMFIMRPLVPMVAVCGAATDV